MHIAFQRYHITSGSACVSLCVVDYEGVICMFTMCVYICPLDRGSVEGLMVVSVRVESHYEVECTISRGVGG